MGTFVEIAILDAGGSRDAGAAVQTAFAAVERVASSMSFHDAASDLSRLNRRAHAGPVRVDPWTMQVLRLARALFDATDGRFDCTVGFDLVDAGLLPAHGPRIASRERASFADVSLQDDDTVRFARPLAIDLGGLAKGFAVDRAVDVLRSHGVASAVVNAGGDLRVLGSTPVPIHVRRLDPTPTLHYAGTLADGAFASSSAYRPGVDTAQCPSALIDTAGGRPIDGRRTYSVVAPTCAIADGLTKALASAGRLDDRCREAFGAVPMIH